MNKFTNTMASFGKQILVLFICIFGIVVLFYANLGQVAQHHQDNSRNGKLPEIRQSMLMTSNSENTEAEQAESVKEVQKEVLTSGQPKEAEVHVYDFNLPLTGTFDCMTMGTSPSATICLYPSEKDIWISRMIRTYGLWEGEIIYNVKNALEANPNAGFIDLGANIGAFTLPAAAMDRKVLAVEPMPDNIHLLAKAVQLNHFEDRVTLLSNAVSDYRGKADLLLHHNNQGGLSLRINSTKQNSTGRETIKIDTILLDDIQEYIMFPEAVMKIDIELQETRAFMHAQKFLDSVRVSHIFMEWFQKAFYDDLGSNEHELVVKMLYMLTNRGYVPKTHSGEVLVNNTWNEWPKDIVWELQTGTQ